jgi:hypothetical protein
MILDLGLECGRYFPLSLLGILPVRVVS